MNFLAHLYLSGNNSELMIGNFIADHIKGNKFGHYSKEIQKGILLHRKIDSFTDSHDIVKKSKRRLHTRYGHYDGVIIDIFYDYFLAKNWHEYSSIPLKIFSKSFYQLLNKNYEILPEKTKQILPELKQYDWIYNYHSLQGIKNVLKGMNKRTNGKSKMNLAIEDLREMENDFQNDFTSFFKELINYCNKQPELLK